MSPNTANLMSNFKKFSIKVTNNYVSQVEKKKKRKRSMKRLKCKIENEILLAYKNHDKIKYERSNYSIFIY